MNDTNIPCLIDRYQPHGRNEAGFILPSTLIYIFIVSVVIFATAQIVDGKRALAVNLQESRLVSSALDQAEGVVSYAYLTSRPVQGGVLIGAEPIAANQLLGNFEVSGQTAPGGQFLSLSGGSIIGKIGDVEVSCSIYDVNGLVSLVTTDENFLSTYLATYDFATEQPSTIVAKLRDYQDEDIRRRFQGGERADYRLQRRNPPTNSPLRHLFETNNILGWNVSTPEDKLRLAQEVTTMATVNRPISLYSPEAIKRTLEKTKFDTNATQRDPITSAMMTEFPSGSVRIVLKARIEGSSTVTLRIVDLERQPAGVFRPFSRQLTVKNWRNKIGDMGLSNDQSIDLETIHLSEDY